MPHRQLRSASYMTLLTLFACAPLAAQEAVIQPRQSTAVTTVDHRVPSGYFLETQIQCPNRMDIRVSGPPGGWESSVSRVSSENPRATIDQVGGQPRLVCHYLQDETYSYHRTPPAEESRCRVISESLFGCRRPGDWLNDTGSTALTSQVNFDNRFDPVSYDFRIIVDADENQRYVSSLRENSKSLATAGGIELSKSGCESRLSGSGVQRIPLAHFTPGSRWCFQTLSSRIGWFEVTSVNRGVPRVDYTTFAH